MRKAAQGAYRGFEIEGRRPRKVVTLPSRHDPSESMRLTYYVRCRGDILAVAKRIARDETTGSWVGKGKPTAIFERSQADVESVEVYAENEGIITIRSPILNMDMEGDLLYQFLMLAIGGPILEFVYYDRVAFLDFELPEKLLRRFPGPKFGIRGTRKLLALPDGVPVIGTIMKPCAGLTDREVARKAYEAAAGGVRFLKDDEKMLSPRYCPFERKVRRVVDALKRAADETGQNCLYAPQLCAGPATIRERALRAIELGATGIMFNVLVAGLPVLAMLAADGEIRVPIYVHSGGRTGLSTGPRRVDDVVIAKLVRLCGGDYFQIGVMNMKECLYTSLFPSLLLRLNAVFTEKLGRMRDTVSVTAGGLSVHNMMHQLEAFGADFMALAGSAILNHPDGPRAGVDAMLAVVEAWRKKVPLGEYAKGHPALGKALGAESFYAK
ncbi:MAG: RuBisCO large subunit C-terminal-like domain-containing protein [Planctomycetota bacterium]